MIRQLKPGEKLPAGSPRRYIGDHGYVRVRWRLGPGQYVETYEHRVVDGHVTTAPHVHHRNGIRDDNRPENLEPITPAKHGAEHRTLDWDEICRLYRAGLSTNAVARQVGTDSAHIYRVLVRQGVSIRTTVDYCPQPSHDEVLRAHAASRCAREVADRLGVTITQARRIMRLHGVPSFPNGRRAA
jgi:hypothetical protein